MSATLRKVALQLIKEFWLPLTVSIAWTTYVLWGKTPTLQEIGGNFGGAFFFTSWITGQIFRVRKQAGVESSLFKVEGRLLTIADQLEKRTNELMGHLTGGANKIRIQVLVGPDGYSDWLATHLGTEPYTMYNVSVRILDEDHYLQGVGLEQYVEIGDMTLGTAKKIHSMRLGDGTLRRFRIYIIARNGHSTQTIVFRKVDNVWRQASRYEDAKGAITGSVDDSFPRNENGEVEWS